MWPFLRSFIFTFELRLMSEIMQFGFCARQLSHIKKRLRTWTLYLTLISKANRWVAPSRVCKRNKNLIFLGGEHKKIKRIKFENLYNPISDGSAAPNVERVQLSKLHSKSSLVLFTALIVIGKENEELHLFHRTEEW